MNSYTQTLSEILQKVKIWTEEHKNDLFIAALIFLVGMASFGLGRLSAAWPKKEPIRIEKTENSDTALQRTDNKNLKENEKFAGSAVLSAKGKYVASKSGKAYHFPWCSGALKIKESNRVWFNSKEDAEAAGYTPAANCEGL